MNIRYEYVKKWRYRAKYRAVQAFGGCCGICGYNKCIFALEFHHLDPIEKDFSFGSMRIARWDKLVKELKKCVCLCANCHREISAGILKVPDNIKRFDEKYIEYKEPFKEEYDICPVCKDKKRKRYKYCSKLCAAYANRKVDWDSFDLKSMIDVGMPIEVIAGKIGVSGNAVRKRLKNLKLPIRREDRNIIYKKRRFRQTIGPRNGCQYKGVE